MIAMTVTVDQMGDRLVRHCRKVGFEPCGGFSIDGINDNNTVVCYGNKREMKIVLETINITGNLGNASLGLLGIA